MCDMKFIYHHLKLKVWSNFHNIFTYDVCNNNNETQNMLHVKEMKHKYCAVLAQPNDDIEYHLLIYDKYNSFQLNLMQNHNNNNI